MSGGMMDGGGVCIWIRDSTLLPAKAEETREEPTTLEVVLVEDPLSLNVRAHGHTPFHNVLPQSICILGCLLWEW